MKNHLNGISKNTLNLESISSSVFNIQDRLSAGTKRYIKIGWSIIHLSAIILVLIQFI